MSIMNIINTSESEIMEKLDRFSNVPLYHQLKEIIRRNILLGVWKPGDRIPSERELSKKYEVSLMVVRQALSLLVNEGFLVRKQGKGTFVVKSKIMQGPRRLRSFSEEILELGYKPKAHVLEARIIPADEKLQSIFSMDKEERIVVIKRLRFADEEPIAIQYFYCPEKLTPDILKKDLTSSLYRILEKDYGVQITHAKEKYFAILLDKHECKYLKLNWPSAGFVVERISYDSSNMPVEYTLAIARSDMYFVELELER